MSLKMKKVIRLTEVQEKRYLTRKEISSEISKMEARIRELKENRSKIDVKLAPVFEQYGGRRTLSDGTIVDREVVDVSERVATTVGQLIQSGYSYPKYKELAG